MLMESDYAYRLLAVNWARCLLEWARACKAPAIVHEGSSPSAPIRHCRHRMSGIGRGAMWVGRWIFRLGCWALKAVRWALRGLAWLLETPVHSYRQYW